MITANVPYQAKSADEFQSLVDYICSSDIPATAEVAPPVARASGNFVEQYLTHQGEQRFRLSIEEREEFERVPVALPCQAASRHS